MAVYTPVKHPDGTFELTPNQLSDLREKHTDDVIFAALLKLYELNKPQEKAVEVQGDVEPCECGSVSFLRTGTCHVCLQCGTSQGCS